MNKAQEDELLIHVAAGTDLLTALAALPRETSASDEPPTAPKKTGGGLLRAVLVFMGITDCGC